MTIYKQLLTDFSEPKYKDVNLGNLEHLVEVLNDQPIFGEIGRAKTTDINLKEVSHQFENVMVDGTKLIGDVTYLDTNLGKQAMELIKYGATFHIKTLSAKLKNGAINMISLHGWDIGI